MAATRTSPSKSPTTPVRQVRCAIYTRKSTDENLDTDFNSLDAQREAAEAYIASQKNEGWVALPDRYDDPAFSAATTDRPALQRLLADVEAGSIDTVVVYKIDRLSRSLRDFGRLMETFEKHGVAFVSVTQRFDTSSSMGKLTLNILMSFAEFEREVTRERIRDKIAAAKRRGKHCGGVPILGYDTDRVAKRLLVNQEEAKLVRSTFERFLELRSTTRLAKELNQVGHRTKAWVTMKGRAMGGHEWTKAELYKVFNNSKYIGKVDHKGTLYQGEHEALVSQQLWNRVHTILAEQHRAGTSTQRAETPALLKGVIKCAACDCSMGPTFTRKGGKTHVYYLCVQASKRGYASCPVRSVSAATIEAAVITQLRAVFRTPELVARTYRQAKLRETEEIERLRSAGDDVAARVLEDHPLAEQDVIDAMGRLDPVWDQLFPAEQHRIVQLLVERVDVRPDGLELRLRGAGLKSLVAELREQNKVSAG